MLLDPDRFHSKDERIQLFWTHDASIKSLQSKVGLKHTSRVFMAKRFEINLESGTFVFHMWSSCGCRTRCYCGCLDVRSFDLPLDKLFINDH